MAARKATRTSKKTNSKGGVNLTVKRVTGKKTAKNVTPKTIAKKPAKKRRLIIREKQTRIEILNHIAEQTNISKTQVEAVFLELKNLISAHMGKKGSGEINLPIIGIKVKRIRKDKTKARNMISPLTGKEVHIAAKPSRQAVKVVMLKVLKETVAS